MSAGGIAGQGYHGRQVREDLARPYTAQGSAPLQRLRPAQPRLVIRIVSHSKIASDWETFPGVGVLELFTQTAAEFAGEHGPTVGVGADGASRQVGCLQVQRPRRQKYGKLTYAGQVFRWSPCLLS